MERAAKPRAGTGAARRLVAADVDTRLAVVPLLVCCFASGLIDSTIYNGESLLLLPSSRLWLSV